MPTCIIRTNVQPSSDLITRLLNATSAELAGLLQKPERYVMVLFDSVQQALFAQTDAPLAYLELKSLGLDEAKTPELSAALTRLIQTHLAIPADRVYIEFAAPARHLFGFNGSTF
jgi:phenylpyruvate tautomerase PptA (4-oxalocrotonate tautomerase family)